MLRLSERSLHRVLRVLAVGASLALTAPSLTAGFFGDDMAHVGVMRGGMPPSYPATRVDLFRFATGAPDQNAAMISEGLFAWWTDPHLRVAFLRPLAAVTHWADYAVYDAHPVGHHVTNLLLWMLTLAAAWWAFVRWAPNARAATLALWIFALSDGHALLVTWVANRNALIAGALSFAALALWDGFRRGEGRWRGAAAVAVFALAMLGGEAALGGLLLIAGYELAGVAGTGQRLAQRLFALAPFVLIALGYVVAYKALGYGAEHSGMYIDPTRQPLDWLGAATVRYPALLAGVLWAWPIDFWMSGDEVRRWLIVGSFALALVSVWLFLPVVRRDRRLAGAAIGCALALLPVTSTFPATRLLLVPGLAGAILTGGLIDAALRRAEGTRTRLRRVAAGILGLRLAVAAPVLLVANVVVISDAFRSVRAEVLDTPWPADIASRDVLVLDSPHWASVTYIRPYLAMAGRPSPRRSYPLNLSAYPATLRRTSERTFELRLKCGAMLESDFERVTRAVPMKVGEVVDVAAFRARVLEVHGTGPTAVEFTLRPSDSEPLWIRWDAPARRYQPVTLPPVGGELQLPALAMGLGELVAPAPVCRG